MPETAISDVLIYSARPTVRIDTQEYAKVTELLIGMEMNEQEGGLSSLELRFSNVASDPRGGADYAFEEDDILRLGKRVAVYGGDEMSPREIFQGVITGIEAEFPADDPPELVVLAEDALQQARMLRRTRTYEELSLSDLADEIAGRLGLTAAVTGFTETIGTWVQLNESDLAFLRRLLQRYDGDVQIVGNQLQVSPRGEVRRGELELVLHSQLHQARFVADLAQQVTELTVTGWNPLQGQRVSGSSRGANSGPGEGTDGASLLRDSLGERRHHISHLAVATDTEATAAAEAAFDRRARRFVCVDGTADGNPSIRVGTHVRLTGTGPRFDNTYYVVRTRHRWDVNRGYETDFEGECAYWGG